MSLRSFLTGLLCLAGLAGLAAANAVGGQPYKVTSSIDGKAVLPHRLHWLAYPALAPAKIKKVDFLIDGKLSWTEIKTPYVYAADNEHGGGYGYLVTSFLTPGEHRFEVRAVATDGSVATDTVTARVLPPPPPPAALAGTWQRTIQDTSAAPKPGTAGNPTDTGTPPGKYTITFDRRWIHDVFPCDTSPCRFNPQTGGGGEFISDWVPGTTRFSVQGAVTIRILHDTDRLGGSWCYNWGPPAVYNWSISGNTLTLAPVGGHDACAIRGFIWTGTWTRVG
jgi:hypothetical protein